MSTLGDFDPGITIYDKFTTYRPSTGAPYTLGGSPALSVYKDNSTTQSTGGVSLTVDFDSVTGFHHYSVDTSADGTFYSAGSFFSIVITAGSVDGVSSVGSVVGRFTLRKNSSLKPTTPGQTVNASQLDTLGTHAKLSVTGTATTGATTTSIPTSSLSPAASVTNQFKGRVVVFDNDTTTVALRGQASDITASTADGTLTVTALTTAPANGDTFRIV